MDITKNKLLLFVAFLAAIAVVYYRVDYGKQVSKSLDQTSQTISASTTVTSTAISSVAYQDENKLIKVLRVIDGDTIVVDIDGQQIHVRLIGVDSPELNDKRTQVVCLGQKAKEEAQKLLDGKNIYLEKDQTQGDYDKYRRLLAYVFLSNGVNLNKLMIENGYAYEYTYYLPYKYQSEFRDAQNKARAAKKGLWSSNICSN